MIEVSRVHGRDADAAAFSRYNVVELIADWCEGLQGGLTIRHSLRNFVIDIGAEAGMVVRVLHENNHPTKFLEVDLRGSDPLAPKLRRSYASCVLKKYLTKARSSGLWLSSHNDNATNPSGDPSLIEWQSARSLSELAVIVLSRDKHKSEFLELHLRGSITPGQYRSLEALIPTMCRAWSNRAAGIFSAALLDKQGAVRADNLHLPILGYNNPAQLSRSEFRVCMMLSRGVLIEAVASELSITIATVRSHLSSIYSKTDTSGHAELVYRLLSSQPPDASITALSA